MAVKMHTGDRVFVSTVYAVMVVVFLITLYPILYVLSMSLSAPEHVLRLEVFLFPKGFSLGSYKYLFDDGAIFQYYSNTIYYTVTGTLFSMVLTLLGGYVMAQPTFSGRKPIMTMFVITMFFSGGMIPNFLLIRDLGMYDSPLAMIIPGAVATYYIILARTFFMSLPPSLFESARIDGADDMQMLWRIVIPLSLPIVSVLVLYYAVGKWNSYFNALLYLPSKKYHPLQLYLVNLLISNTADVGQSVGSDEMAQRGMTMLQLKYSAIIVSILPIMCIYPFLQKYFVKGVMIGAIKG